MTSADYTGKYAKMIGAQIEKKSTGKIVFLFVDKLDRSGADITEDAKEKWKETLLFS